MLRQLRQSAPLALAGRVRRLAQLSLGLLLTSLLLTACNSTPTGGVQVVDRNGRAGVASARAPATSGQHVVQRGDTLYSIAFRFGWDWQTLAQRNNIAAPYVIKAGQIIRFDGRAQSPSVASRVARVSSSPRAKPQPVAMRPASRPTSVSTQSAAKTPVSAPPATFTGRWTWPAKGTVIGRFSSNGSLNKGIDIAGDLGEPVVAASDGSVVYAGSGLRGYGELVIIKHSDTYVSAYGHNRKLLVREGQQVKVGQVIAEMGSTGTDRVKLHFEIRRQGKPVDPQQYLPKR